MGKWVRLYFVINGDTLRTYTSETQEGDATYEVKVGDCAVRLPKSERKGHPWVFRIDTSTKDKLMVDPGDEAGRESGEQKTNCHVCIRVCVYEACACDGAS